ncbi:MAG TPA: hypothetical protein VF015_14155 [Acidimicrobiales bacterium]
MAITEHQRHELYEGLIEVLGREKATTLMEHLPPVGWADVATKRDLDHQSVVTRRDIELANSRLRSDIQVELANLRTEMQTDFASVRTEMQTDFASVRTEMQTEFANVRTEMRAGLDGVRTEIAELRTETHDAIAGVEVRFERALREQSRTFFLGMLGANASLAALAFGAAQIT